MIAGIANTHPDGITNPHESRPAGVRPAGDPATKQGAVARMTGSCNALTNGITNPHESRPVGARPAGDPAVEGRAGVPHG